MLSKIPGLVMHLPLNESSGSTAFDNTRYDNDGSLGGGDSAKMPVWVEHGLRFDGTDDYVDCGNIGNLIAPFTISVWVYFNQETQAGYDYVFFSGDGANSIAIARWQATNQFYSVSGENIFKGEALAGQQWLHIVVKGNANTPYLEVYVNGVITTVEQPGAALSTNGATSLGYYVTGGTHYIDGIIDNPQIYSYALSAAEIKVKYNAEKHKYV